MPVYEGQPNRNWHIQISSNYKLLSSTEINELGVIESNTCLIIWAQERKKNCVKTVEPSLAHWRAWWCTFPGWLLQCWLACGLCFQLEMPKIPTPGTIFLLPWKLFWCFSFLIFFSCSKYKMRFVHKAWLCFLFNREEINFSKQYVLYSNT